jgi:hypothetical protein
LFSKDRHTLAYANRGLGEFVLNFFEQYQILRVNAITGGLASATMESSGI